MLKKIHNMKTPVLYLLLLISNIYAHQINIFGFYENKTLFIEGFFINGNPCSECRVDITDFKNRKHQFNLDSDGVLEKSIELTRPIKIILSLDDAHKKELILEKKLKSEITDSKDIDSNLKIFIESKLDSQFEKIKIELAKQNSNIDKIISALGYILGIFGLWVFLKRR